MAVNMKLESTNLVQSGNMINVKFSVTLGNKGQAEYVSNEYYICGLTILQVKVCGGITYEGFRHATIFLRLAKVLDNDPITYYVRFTSKNFYMNDKVFFADDTTWRLLYEKKNIKHSMKFDIIAHLELSGDTSQFYLLHEDTEFADFKLKGDNGSVFVHKLVLAGSSPVFKTMLSGEWKEVEEGSVQVPGTTKETLEHFKDYLYLNKLPESGIKSLMLLASYYIMEDLEQKCVFKLLSTLTAKTAYPLLELGIKLNIRKIVMVILASFERGILNVKDVENAKAKEEPNEEYALSHFNLFDEPLL